VEAFPLKSRPKQRLMMKVPAINPLQRHVTTLPIMI
jgi:hypothetical protein